MSSGIKARLAVLASGGGSNAAKIISYFDQHESISVEVVITNNPHAGVRHVAQQHGKPFQVISRKSWKEEEVIVSLLQQYEITHVILAGFLQLIPNWLVEQFPHRIINIHPALLPKYGGRGMYGHHVHEAVKAAGESFSGITIHEVDEHYDQGDILFQYQVPIDQKDTPEEIASKVLVAEHFYYPRVIEKWILHIPMNTISKQHP